VIGAPTRRHVRTAEIMGTVVSVHAHLEPDAPPTERLERAIDAALADLRLVDRLCSTYRDGSEVLRIADGRLALHDAHPLVRELAARCDVAAAATDGRVTARWKGRFDPTGVAKGWAVERAFDAHLRPLLGFEGLVGLGMGAGGDLQLAAAAGADRAWRIGIADPRRQGGVLATIEVEDGAVATSGSAERGDHIVDPRTGRPAVGTLSATVVASSLTDADVWATAAVVAGAHDLSWIAAADTRAGLVVGADGAVRRWSGPAEVVAARAIGA
jgi:FAD:protein FMN transferase